MRSKLRQPARSILTCLAAALLLLLPGELLAAPQTDLEVGQAVSEMLAPGESRSFTLALSEGDFVGGAIDQISISVDLKIFGPDGQLLTRVLDYPRGQSGFGFIAPGTGTYRFVAEGLPNERTTPGRFSLVIQRRMSAAAIRGLIGPEPLESALLRGMVDDLREGRITSDGFWQRIDSLGTPLVESTDEGAYRVTFLWRGDESTRNVHLHWSARTEDGRGAQLLTNIADTDIWYRTVLLPRGARATYQLAPDVPSVSGAASVLARVDPFNPNIREGTWGGLLERSSYLELPGAAQAQWSEPRPGVPAGTLTEFTLSSERLGGDRPIAVYTPAGYSRRGAAYPVVVIFDKEAFLQLVPTPTILDNLIAAGAIPPVIAVFVSNGSQANRVPDLACNPAFADFIAEELLPDIRRRYHASASPDQVTVGGSSMGALAAAYVAFQHPEAIGNVLAHSGSWYWSPTRDRTYRPEQFDPFSEPAWLPHQYATAPTKPLRIYLDAGLLEMHVLGGTIQQTRFFRDILLAKGYDVEFQTFAGGHQYMNWAATMPDGLRFLLGRGGRRGSD